MNIRMKMLIMFMLVVSFSAICGDEEEKNKKYQKLSYKNMDNVTTKDIVHAIIKLEKENKFLVQEVLRLEEEKRTINLFCRILRKRVNFCRREIDWCTYPVFKYKKEVEKYNNYAESLGAEIKNLKNEIRTREVIIGEWYSSPYQIFGQGVTTLFLDREERNTKPNHFIKSSDNLGITIEISGYYQITGKTVVQSSSEQFSIHLLCNDNPIDKCFKSTLSKKKWESVRVGRSVYLEAGSIIKLEAKSDSAIYHLGSVYTRLTIYKLD